MRIFVGLLRKCALPTGRIPRRVPPSPPQRPGIRQPDGQQPTAAATAAEAAASNGDRLRALVDKLFGKYLLWTNTVSCGLLMAAGDAVAQRIESRGETADGGDGGDGGGRTAFDWRRSGIMFAVGFTQGPVQHVFYGWLDRRFLEVTRRNVAKKILLDQSIMSPVAIIQFFLTAGLLEGQTLAESVAELRSKFLTVFMSDCMFWPIMQFINFTFTPAPYRVMYINVLTMLYNVWLSIVKHNDDLKEVLVTAVAYKPPPPSPQQQQQQQTPSAITATAATTAATVDVVLSTKDL